MRILVLGSGSSGNAVVVEADDGARLLIDAGILPATATLDADLLARHVLGWDLATWLTHRSDAAAPDFVDRYQQIVARRARREPVAYIRGVQEFWGREYVVNAAVLVGERWF